MSESDVPTCGKGLAANADLPARLAELLTARAEILERHTKALDRNDANGRQEFEAYMSLVRAHRAIGAALVDLAHEMAGYRDLPMALHDMAVMTDPQGQMAAFRQFVVKERELVEFLGGRLEQDEKMLS